MSRENQQEKFELVDFLSDHQAMYYVHKVISVLEFRAGETQLV